ncbi:MAG: activator-dependent family glycosyltransferase [Actinobacteria bacterium]|nr:activator-dependent family glycosyltransferase [Actinomycetota bacterium]MBI3686978.1 activator-dependent family glycosyltransferase [Actinomycetota bacterium]
MRVLFVPHANKAHLHLMAPLAWALRTAGHDVSVACQPGIADNVMAVGFTPVVVGEATHTFPALPAALVPDGPSAPRRLGPAQRQDMPWQHDYALADPLGELARAAWGFTLFSPDSLIADLLGFARRWSPDLVVWDSMVYAGAVVATACGAAHARMLMGPDAITHLRRSAGAAGDPLRDWLQPVLARYGCEIGEEIAVGQWTIDPMPPWQWRPSGVHYVPVRQIPLNPPALVPDWLNEDQDRDRVCLTLGMSHREGRGTEASTADLLEAVSELDVEVVATFDSAQLGSIRSIPDNVRVVDFVPMSALLPTCSAVVHHGGAGTFATALECGVPQLIVPGTHWSFQWWGPIAHANGLQEQGAGRFVADSDHLTAEALAEDLRRVLKDPSFRANAERLRAEVVGMPAPNDIVPALEKLTWEHRDQRNKYTK